MDSDRWGQIQSIFLSALDRDADHRPAYVASSCGEDLELRAEVEAMLVAHYEQRSLGAEAWLNEEIQSGPSPRVGTRIGPYLTKSLLGRGGMGEVYLAERSDEHYRQEVAIKLLPTALMTPEATQRFRTERQILAHLTHPCIARLLDGGVEEGGRPYLVMEYVRGSSITEHCDREGLDLTARLDLYLDVCDAVDYAHRNLVVHRDVKAPNVLVSTELQVKLLDFGIAKLLAAEADGDEPYLTRTGSRPMTPECAAPEQIRGGPITTATDVYALGILLYELLTGRRPYSLPSDAPEEAVRIICAEEPSRPSAVVTRAPPPTGAQRGTPPGKLRRLLSGDLDNIVMMALRKEPERRYASAGQLAEDIRRYRSGQPVRARADTAAYRVQKFVRRNRGAVSAAAIIALLLLGSSILTALQSRRVGHERDRVRQEAARAEQVTGFLLSLFDAAAPTAAPRDTLRIREILERGRAGIERIADQPDVQANAIQTLSHVYWRLGRNDVAAELAEEGVEIRRRAFGDDDPWTASGLYWLGTIFQSQMRFAEAESLLAWALRIQREAYGRDDPDALKTQFRLGMVLHGIGQTDHADALLDEWQSALALMEGSEDEDLAILLNSLGNYLLYAGRADEAETAILRAREIHSRLHGLEDYRVAADENVLASIYINLGRLDAAEAVARDALRSNRSIFPDGHFSLAVSLDNLGDALARQGRFSEAEPYLLEALEVYRGLYGETHGFAAHGHLVLGIFYRSWGRLGPSEEHLRSAASTYEALHGRDYLITLRARRHLALTLRQAGKRDEAERMLRTDLARLERDRGREDRDTRLQARLLEELLASP